MKIGTSSANMYSSTYPQASGMPQDDTIEVQKVPQDEKPVLQPAANETFKEMTQKQKSELTIDEKNWIDIIERANKAINGATCSFEFSIHKGTKAIMVKVIDNDTKEVIREFPPEKILDMIAKMWDMAGLIVDERR